MSFKKVILILLLIFSILSLFVIVYFSKNKMGMFGKLYDEYVKRNTEIISKTVQTNLSIIKNEVNYLSQEAVVKSIFETYYLSLSDVDTKQVFDIKGKLADCIKIQLIEKDGLIIFSTLEGEAFTQRIKSSVLEKIVKHYSSSEDLFIYFLNNQQFLVISRNSLVVSNEIKDGYVAVYYNSSRLLKGLPSKKLKVPFSYENFMFLSSGNIDKKDLNLIIENYERLKDSKKDGYEKTIGAFSQFDGIKLVYYSKNEKFVSPWTILFLVIDLVLLLLVIFTLFQIAKEEKMYQEIALKNLRTDTVDDSVRSEIGDLVRDIEEDRKVSDDVAEEGIEKMIMQNNVNLYSEPSDYDFNKDRDSFSETESFEKTETFVTQESSDFEPEIPSPYSGEENIAKEKEPSLESPLEVAYEEPEVINIEPEIETPIAVEEKIEEIPEVGTQESSTEPIISDYSELEPDKETKMFAEEENILYEVTNDYIEKEEILRNVTPEDNLKNIEESIEFNIPEVENISLEQETLEEGMADNLNQLEAATNVVGEQTETIEEIENDLKDVMNEPPSRVSMISTVEDYGNVAVDLAKNYLGMSKVSILKKENGKFTTIINDGFESDDIKFDMDDPLISMFLSKGKSVDISGNLNSRYIKSKFKESDIQNLEEIFIVPIAKRGELVGVGFFGREKGVREPTNFQKSELFNMGYLQEE